MKTPAKGVWLKRRGQTGSQSLCTSRNCIETMAGFESMWYIHLSHSRVAKHRIKLTSNETQFVHCASYCTVPRAQGFRNTKIDKMFEIGAIKPAKSWWTAPIAFAAKKNIYLHIDVGCRKLNILTLKDSYPILEIKNCIDSIRQALFSPHSTQSAETGRSRSTIQIATKHLLLRTMLCLNFRKFH